MLPPGLSTLPSLQLRPPRFARSNPHAWTFKEPYYPIDEKFERADGVRMPEGRASVDKIALHHYVLKCGSVTVTLAIYDPTRTMSCSEGRGQGETRTQAGCCIWLVCPISRSS